MRANLARGPAPRVAAAAAALGFLAAGCGGNSPHHSVAQLTTTTSSSSSSSSGDASNTSSKGNPEAYAKCMRSHGVTSFPDPDSQGNFRITGGVANGRHFGIDPQSAPFRKAQQACQKLAPNGGKGDPQEQAKQLQTMLKFAACMRSHGVPKFPDPKAGPGGGVTMTMRKGDGLDPNSPQFQAAQKTCGKLFSGGAGPLFRAGPGPSGGTSSAP